MYFYFWFFELYGALCILKENTKTTCKIHNSCIVQLYTTATSYNCTKQLHCTTLHNFAHYVRLNFFYEVQVRTGLAVYSTAVVYSCMMQLLCTVVQYSCFVF